MAKSKDYTGLGKTWCFCSHIQREETNKTLTTFEWSTCFGGALGRAVSFGGALGQVVSFGGALGQAVKLNTNVTQDGEVQRFGEVRGHALWSKCVLVFGLEREWKGGKGFQQDCAVQLRFPWLPKTDSHIQRCYPRCDWVVLQRAALASHLAAWKKYKSLDFYPMSTAVCFFSPSIQCTKSSYCIFS